MPFLFNSKLQILSLLLIVYGELKIYYLPMLVFVWIMWFSQYYETSDMDPLTNSRHWDLNSPAQCHRAEIFRAGFLFSKLTPKKKNHIL